MSVRKAVFPKETLAIQHLLEQIALSHIPNTSEIENPEHQWFVFEKDDTIFGCVAATRDRGEIRHIVVDSLFRRKGVGSKLVAVAASFLKSEGYEEIWSQVRIDNIPSQNLFKENKFKQESGIVLSRENPEVRLYKFTLFVGKMIEIDLNEKCNYIHLLSGGLDSAYNLLKIAKKFKKEGVKVVIHPIFFDYGHFASKEEWKRVPKIVDFIRNFLCNTMIVSDPVRICLASELFQWCRNDAFLGNIGNPNAEIENRNMVLFSILASYLIACAEHKGLPTIRNENFVAEKIKFRISSGFKRKEMLDSNQAFFKGIENLLNSYKNNLEFHIESLPPMKRKTTEGKLKQLLNGSESELCRLMNLTISCYSPTEEGKSCGICSKCTSIKGELS
jgi:7-cyano-7-deazaguanine synthase in queuosine biosynthesis/N-acetylglutamate synthase-like GNAT family acetyltransferase